MRLPLRPGRPQTALVPALLVMLLALPLRAEEAKAAESATPAPVSEPTEPAADAPAPAGGEAAPAVEEPPPPPKNRSLEYAKELLGKKRADDALKELERATTAANGDPDQLREIQVVRAEALLSRRRPDEARARAIAVELLREKPDGSAFEGAGTKLRDFVEEIRATQVLVLHERITEARPDRPLRLRAGVVDPPSRTERLVLRVRGRGLGIPYAEEEMKLARYGRYQALIRSPTNYAPPGVIDEFAAEYYIAALDRQGAVLDSVGTEKEPIGLTFTTRVPDPAAEVLAAPLPEPYVAPPPPPATPWYLEWYTFTAAGVVVAGVATAIIVANSQPEELPSPRLGVYELP